VATTRSTTSATSPSELHDALEDTFRRGDVDTFLALHEPDAIVRVPPGGEVAQGLEAIRAATAPIISMRPTLKSSVLGVVEGDGLAITHARWTMRLVPDGADPVEWEGRGTVVSRRRPNGSWGIVFDDPMTPA
jgi:ketosteroid isomerase-like protein